MKSLIVTGITFLAITSAAHSAIRLPAIISDNMVLQRSESTPLWGQADAGERVSVRFNDLVAEATADDRGEWRVDLNLANAPQTAGELTISGSNTVTVRNVIVGEVWICSGQSNMEWTVQNSANPDAEAATADFPAIRHFKVRNTIATEPTRELAGQWVVARPDTVRNFTAVGFYFGREIHQKTGRPVGLINSSWGGTDAESWTSDAQLLKNDRYRESIERRRQVASAESRAATVAKYNADLKAWVEQHFNAGGNAGEAAGWARSDHGADDWQTMKLPTMWQNAGIKENGIIWFRKEIDLGKPAAGQAATLALGAIDDFDVTYVNGTEVGRTGPETPSFWTHPRKYAVPAGTLRAGKNVVAVRVTDVGGHGGMPGPADVMTLSLAGDGEARELTGEWTYKVERTIDVSKLPPRPVDPAFISGPNQPAVLYNGMIAPLVPYGIKGAIWYQGENNSGRHAQYQELLGLMVDGWRSDFGRGQFPFYIVQLANFMDRNPQPEDTNWAKLREAQAQAAARLPNSGLAVTTDIGDAKDIHPKNKQDVGKRLAAIALAKDYGQAGEYSGPTYASHRAEGGALRLTFQHTTGGLVAKGGTELKGFAVAGADGQFRWAEAVIDGDSVVVRSPDGGEIMEVRYGWGNNPECNLYNGAGFPAVPFRMHVAEGAKPVDQP